MIYGRFSIVDERIVRWARGTRESVRDMPEDVRWILGRALFRAQTDHRPRIAHPLRGSLRGVSELRIDHGGDTFRLYYTLKCPGQVCVLYSHKKKAKRGGGIPLHERRLISRRYREVLRSWGER